MRRRVSIAAALVLAGCALPAPRATSKSQPLSGRYVVEFTGLSLDGGSASLTAVGDSVTLHHDRLSCRPIEAPSTPERRVFGCGDYPPIQNIRVSIHRQLPLKFAGWDATVDSDLLRTRCDEFALSSAIQKVCGRMRSKGWASEATSGRPTTLLLGGAVKLTKF